MKSIAIAIPCYHEARTIAKVVADFRRQLPEANIYVFDNNSSDHTVLKAQSAGAIIRYVPLQGKGHVVSAIFSTLTENIIVMVDGDDTYSANQVHDLIRPILIGKSDMVVATRLSSHDNRSFRPLHFFGNKMFSWIIGFCCQARIRDALSGYRALSLEAARSVRIESFGFDVETELTMRAFNAGLRVLEMPSYYRERPPGSLSKLKTFRDGWKILRRIILTLRDTTKNKLIAIFIALAICAGWFGMTREQAFGNAHCSANFSLAVATLNTNVFNGPDVWQQWRVRIGGLLMEGEVTKLFGPYQYLTDGKQVIMAPASQERFKNAFGFYQSAWLLATFALFIIFLADPIPVMGLVVIGMLYSYSNNWAQINILPWDRPMMFFWALAFILWKRKNYWSMIAAIIIGTTIKESISVAALLVFFSGDGLLDGWRKKVALFLTAFFACLLIRVGLTHLMLGQSAASTIHCSIQGHYLHYLKYFMGELFAPRWNSLLWVNGGLSVICFLFIRPKTLADAGTIITLAIFGFMVLLADYLDCGGGGQCDIDVREWAETLPVLAIYFRERMNEA